MNHHHVKNSYQLKALDDILVFRTTSFRAEKASVLHSGVYTGEFASMMVASSVSILFYALTAYITEGFMIVRLILLVIIFISAFLFSKYIIFKERYLEAVFDRKNRTATITRSGIINRKELIPFDSIKKVEIGSKKFEPHNIDAVNFVQRISLQHGSAVPGLEAAEEYVTLSLKLKDNTERTIFADRIEGEPRLPLKEINNYLNIREE